MTILLFVLAFVVCAFAVLFGAVRSRSRHAVLMPVDIAAFHALMSRDDELFLREHLSRSSFVRLKRERVRLSLKYVDCIAGNAAAVIRLGELGRSSQDPEVAASAARVSELATEIRLQCLLAFARLGMEFAFPWMRLTPARLAPKYQSLRENVLRLGTLQAADDGALALAI
ncbi:MAG TPA: hypothetical protein VKT33_02410 [Candidatus Angelobacter sp.]|nr:hypothetical protein [Candidatus Angelobacter sp.]